MLEFLKQNWYSLIVVALAIGAFLIALVKAMKSKGSNIFDTVKEALLESIPTWAVISEELASGEDKKANVIALGIALASKMLGRKLNADESSYFISFITEQLEKILTAPQKKLTVTQKKVSRYTVR